MTSELVAEFARARETVALAAKIIIIGSVFEKDVEKLVKLRRETSELINTMWCAGTIKEKQAIHG